MGLLGLLLRVGGRSFERGVLRKKCDLGRIWARVYKIHIDKRIDEMIPPEWLKPSLSHHLADHQM